MPAFLSQLSSEDLYDRQMTTQSQLLELKYRKTVFYFFYTTVFLCLAALLIVFRLNILRLQELPWYDISFKLLLAASIPITILIRAFFFFAPRLFSHYKADAAKLMITRWGHTREIYYEQINCIRFSKLSPRFFGGFRIRLKSGTWLRFPSLMENSSHLLKMIQQSRPDLADRDEFDRFSHTASLVEVSWQRLRGKWRNWKVILFKYFAYPAVIATFFHGYGFLIVPAQSPAENWLFWFAAIFTGHLFLAFTLNHFEEKLNNQHLLNHHMTTRQPEFEKKIAIASHMVFYLLTAGLTAAVLFGI